jgi:hypothetical protein
MKMTPGLGSITNYGSYVKNCTLRQSPYKIPVNNLQDVQLYIAIGSMPDAVQYELIHTCGPNAGTIETLTTSSYIIGQDSNFDWYGVFKNFDNTTNPITCFVIAITLTLGATDQIYFSEEYCKENSCNDLTLLQGCYGNLDNKLSYDAEGIYFGTHAGEGSPMGDTNLVYKHQLLLRSVEVTLQAIKNTFKQGRTRNFRTEKEKLYQFWSEPIPEWYLPEIDSVFYRGEVFVGDTHYLVNDTQFEKIEDCKKMWKPTATFKENFYQSFSCEVDPCAPPEQTCCEVLGVSAVVESLVGSGEDGAYNQITILFTGCEPTPENGYNVQWRVAGSADAYTDAGNFTTSPAVFTDSTNPPGTSYEGIIRSDCGEVFGESQSWTAIGTTEESGGEFDFSGNVDNRTAGTATIEFLAYGGIALDYNSGDTLPMSGPGTGNYSLPYLTSGDTLTILIGGAGTFTQVKVTDNAGDQVQAYAGAGLYYFILTINPMFPILRIEVS